MQITIGIKTFDYLTAVETEEYINGASRRVLTVECRPHAIGIDLLNTLLGDEASTTMITLSNDIPGDDGNAQRRVTNIYEGYVLKLACGIQSVKTQEETSERPASYEDRLVIKMGKRTYIEQALHQLGVQV